MIPGNLLIRVSAAILLSLLIPSIVVAECSEVEHTAVFLISGLAPGESPTVALAAVAPVGDVTYPANEQIYSTIMNLYQEAVNPATGAGPVLGNLCLWHAVAGSDHQTLVDLRDGRVLFAGTVIWMGSGEVFLPGNSSHEWSMVDGAAAPGPAQTAVFENSYWGGETPTAEEALGQGLDLIRLTDIMHSFGGCGEYTATGIIYTPVVGAVDPWSAQLVIVVEGLVGAPWNDQSLAAESISWDGIKAVYR